MQVERERESSRVQDCKLYSAFGNPASIVVMGEMAKHEAYPVSVENRGAKCESISPISYIILDDGTEVYFSYAGRLIAYGLSYKEEVNFGESEEAGVLRAEREEAGFHEVQEISWWKAFRWTYIQRSWWPKAKISLVGSIVFCKIKEFIGGESIG